MTSAPATGPRASEGGRARSALLTGALLLPASIWYFALLVVPMAFVVVFSFGQKAKNGGYTPAFSLDNYGQVLKGADPFIESLKLASAGTLLTLLVALPLAYFLATRAGRHKGLFILLLVIPFWTSFLIRTYSWLIVLGKGNLGGFIGGLLGNPDFRLLGTPGAILLGLVYGYLPLMIFPLYVTLERMDRSLIEASKDLGAGRWATFRQITLPVALPGLVTGSILVFIPMMGEYVIPQILGYGRTFLIGNALVLDFLEARNWPLGSAKAVILIAIMLVTISVYVWFVNRGRQAREVSVL
ncbi:MAG: spermidine/putrescine transport system permease protein [Chloroflexota bacterium]|jgi:spermidine/putrescine transport system permease protein|nr:spermidine/putrescine transport system permease protein [Chloroflexota bacterium]